MAFTSIEVWPISMPIINGRTYKRTPPCNWCNADSIVHVKRTSIISGNTYTDYACGIHAKEWGYSADSENYKGE